MERRGFLQVTAGGALFGLAGAGASGCGAAPVRLGQVEADDLLARLDNGLRSVRSAPRQSNRSRRNRVVDEMVALGMEALVVADVAKSIPAGAEIPTALADRLREELPVLDRATAAYSGLLAEMPREARRHVQEHMRANPDYPMRVAEWIDERAAAHRVSHESRLRLRNLAGQVTARVRRQSVGAVIDDTVGKVERIVEHHGAELAWAREVGTSALTAGIWRSLDAPHQQEPGTPEPEGAQQGGAGDEELIIGGVLMGSGVAVFGIATLVGALAGDLGIGIAVGATVGGILLIVGLSVLIVGVAETS